MFSRYFLCSLVLCGAAWGQDAAPMPVVEKTVRLVKPQWSPDGRYLTARYTVGADEFGREKPGVSYTTLRAWDLKTGDLSGVPWRAEPTNRAKEASFEELHATSQEYVVAPGAGLNFWEWAPNGSLLISNSLDAWKWPRGPLMSQYKRPPYPKLSSKYSAKQDAAYRSVDNFPKRGDVRCLAVAPDNTTVAVGTDSFETRMRWGYIHDHGPYPWDCLALWNAQNGAMRILHNWADVGWVAFSPHGKLLGAQISEMAPRKPSNKYQDGINGDVERQNSIEVWDWEKQKLVSMLPNGNDKKGGRGKYWVLGWLDDRKILLGRPIDLYPASPSKSIYPDLKIWDTATSQTSVIKPGFDWMPTKDGPADRGLIPSLQNSLLVLQSTSTSYWLMLPEGREFAEVPCAREEIRSTPVISPDHKLIAVETVEGVQFWRPAPQGKDATLAATLALLPPSKPGAAPDWLAWTPDGFFDGSPGAIEQIRWRQDGKLLPGAAFASRRRAGLLGQLAR